MSIHAVVGDKVSSIEWEGGDLGRGPVPKMDMAMSPDDPIS